MIVNLLDVPYVKKGFGFGAGLTFGSSELYSSGNWAVGDPNLNC